MSLKKTVQRSKTHNANVDAWIVSTQQKINETISFEFAKSIGVLAKFIRDSEQGGWLDFDKSEYLILTKMLSNEDVMEFNQAHLESIRLQLSEFQEMAAARVSPKKPKPNDIMAAALTYLTFGKKMTEYQDKFSKPVSSSKKKQKRDSSDDKAERRNMMMSQLIENLFQALAVASTPIDVLDGDEKHNKGRTSSTDLQIQTLANGLAQNSIQIARTKKKSQESEKQARKIEKATLQYTSQYSLKVRENILERKDEEIRGLTSDLGSKTSELEKVQKERTTLEQQLKEEESKLSNNDKQLKQLTEALDKSKHQLNEITGTLTRTKNDLDSLQKEKQQLVNELKRLKDEFEEQASIHKSEISKEKKAHEETKTELNQERRKGKEKIEQLEMQVQNLQKFIEQREEKHHETLPDIQHELEKSKTTIDTSKLSEENDRLKREIKLLRSQLEKKSQGPSVARKTLTNKTPEVDHEQISQLIDDIKQHHQKVSSQRKHILGRMFKGVHTAKRDEYFKLLDNVKRSRISPEDKFIQVNELTEDYVQFLAKGKSVRYLSNMIEFLEGKNPDKKELHEYWAKVGSDTSVVESLDEKLNIKVTRPDVR